MKDIRYNSLMLKPYSTKELAGIYQVSRKTFNKWIKKFSNEIGEKSGQFYNVRQVQVIFDKLGFPGFWEQK